jgi:nucleoside-diphosphate-sugar epimerase
MAVSTGRVLLTGANGFVASHIVQGLIARNYHIVGTVRSEQKARDVIALHPSWKDHITWAYIADIGVTDVWEEVFKSGPFDYIIHNASPVDFTVKDFQLAMIDPAVKGYVICLTSRNNNDTKTCGSTTSLLEASQRLGGSTLKRVVISGSTASVSDYFHSVSKAREPYTEADWNEVGIPTSSHS